MHEYEILDDIKCRQSRNWIHYIIFQNLVRRVKMEATGAKDYRKECR